MLNAAPKKKVVNRVVSSIKVKEEPKTKPQSSLSEEVRKEPEKDPYVPRPGKPEEETKKGEKDASEKPGKDKSKKKASSSSGEVVKEEKGPPKEFEQEFYEGFEITGNEHDSVLRRLQETFYHVISEQWCGFYNKGFPCYPSLRHFFWRKMYRILDPHQRPHAEAWHTETEDAVMNGFISRHRGEEINELLSELVKTVTYSCNDPRLHEPFRAEVERKDRKDQQLPEVNRVKISDMSPKLSTNTFKTGRCHIAW